ncbi:MAG TPA: Ig-like domain-containing protein [Thermoleophilaceae bacterium]|nr:Ig-like domain-containing protein [Thermoleophilaceae bacterium]
MLAFAGSASAVTPKQASKRAVAAFGSAKPGRAVIVYGVANALRPGARITQPTAGKRARHVIDVGKQSAFLFYEDGAPYSGYPHPGRVALVGEANGKVRLSGPVTRRPRVNGARPAFKRVFIGDPFAPVDTFVALSNKPPAANPRSASVKRDTAKLITLTGSDDDGDLLTFFITKGPDHGTLSGVPPDVVYTPAPGYVGADDFHFKTDDSDAVSNAAKVSITVRPRGNPAVVTASSGCTSYTEQTPAVVVDPAIAVTDADDTVLDSATVRIATNREEADDLRFTDQNGISGSYDDDTGVLLLSGESSIANYQAALRSVRYRNLSVGTPAATKNIEFRANDAGGDSAPATKQVCITEAGPNDKPVGGTSEGALNYTENDGPVPIDPDFFITDADSANLSGAIVKFAASQASEEEEIGTGGPGASTSTYVPPEDVLAFNPQNGITGTWDDVNGVLTLSGTSSVANYEAAIRSVTYENTSEDPSDATRAIRFQLTDADGANSVASSRGILVTPVNDAPVVTASDGVTAYTEGDPATTVDSGLTTGDVDNTELQGGTVKIADGFQSGDDLIYVDQLGISGVYSTGTGELTLSGTASVADYETALRSIQFRGTDDDPPATKTVEFVVNDGELDSATSSKTIAVTPVNDSPVLGASGAALSYTEGDGAVAADDGITVSDVDSPNLAGATAQITGNYNSGEDSLSFEEQNGIGGTFDSETGTLILSGSASQADYQTALRSITYSNSSENPSTATRTVSFQVDDGASSDNLSNLATRDIAVTAVNDAPSVTTSGGSTTYTEGDSEGVLVDDALSIADPDDDNLESASVRIATGFDAGDELVYNEFAGIVGNYDSETGVLTLTGTASVVDYTTALRSIAFRTTAESPSASKSVEFTVNDGDLDSEVASKAIDVVQPPTNVAPVVVNSAGSTSYGSGDPAVAVDPALTVTDADDTNLEGATVRITAGFDSSDVLGFADTDDITASYDPENGVLNLGGTASVADYEAALRSVTFSSNGANPSARTVEFKANDGDLDSLPSSKLIDIGPPTF